MEDNGEQRRRPPIRNDVCRQHDCPRCLVGCLLVWLLAYVRACLLAFPCSRGLSCVRACALACVLARLRACWLACLRACVHDCVHARLFACLLACLHDALLATSFDCIHNWLSALTPTDEHVSAERRFCDPTTHPPHTQGPSTHSDQDRNAGPLALASWRITVSNDADPQPTTISAVIVMVAPLLGWLSACVSACLRACLRDCLLATLLACSRACAIA